MKNLECFKNFLTFSDVTVGAKVDCPKWWKWTVPKLDGRSKMDAPAESERSWVKVDGPINNGWSTRWFVGPGVKWTAFLRKVDGPKNLYSLLTKNLFDARYSIFTIKIWINGLKYLQTNLSPNYVKFWQKLVKTWSRHPIFDIFLSFWKIFEKFTFIWIRKTETYLMISSSACNCIIDNRWIIISRRGMYI